MNTSVTENTFQQGFHVPFSYPVHFGRNLLDGSRPLLAGCIDRDQEPGRRRVLICLDDGVAEAQPELETKAVRYLEAHADRLELAGDPFRVPGGERAKRDRRVLDRVLREVAARRPCRRSTLLALGGGSMLDIAGLAAALVHRGIRMVRMPTSVLSQNDSGVGVKNGIDAFGAKNFLGVFAPPFAVLVDFDLLRTLPDTYRLGGWAEAYKVALIRDADFFEYLRKHAGRLRNNDPEVVEEAIRRCALLHLAHIRDGGDPFEFGAARPLDFGHWSAHRLEVLSDYTLGHGQAVAIGIALDSYVAYRLGYLTENQVEAVIGALLETGLSVWSPLLESVEPDGTLALRRGLDDFREHLGGALTVTLPDGFGRGIEVAHMDWSLIEEGIRYLKRRSVPLPLQQYPNDAPAPRSTNATGV